MGLLSAEIAKVRDTLQDEETPPRTSDAKLVGYANDFVRELALLRPDLFATIGDIPCTAGAVLQSAPAGALVLVDIFQVKNGAVVTESKRAHLDRFNPNWPNDPSGAAESWFRHEKDPLKFFIYPKAPNGQVLVGQWAVLPALMTAPASQIPVQVPEAYYTALHHYIVFRIESKDDEYAVNGRAKLFFDGYAGLVGLGHAAKKMAEQPEKERADQINLGG